MPWITRLLSFLLIAGTTCFGQSVDEILGKVAATYRDAKSLRLELTEKHKEKRVAGYWDQRSGRPPDLLSRKFKVSLALERPDKLRLSIQGLEFQELWRYTQRYDFGDYYIGRRRDGLHYPTEEDNWVLKHTREKSNYLAVADGDTLWTCLVDRRQYTQRPVNRFHTGELHSAMDFLIGRYRNFPDYAPDARIVKHAKLKRSGRAIPCVVIQAAGREFWIDEQRYLVLLERISKNDTLTWNVAELNPTLPPATFTFTPPKNAKLLGSLATPPPELE